MSVSEKTKLVHVVANETKDDPTAEHARRITELATAMDKPHVFREGTTRSMESRTQESSSASL